MTATATEARRRPYANATPGTIRIGTFDGGDAAGAACRKALREKAAGLVKRGLVTIWDRDSRSINHRGSLTEVTKWVTAESDVDVLLVTPEGSSEKIFETARDAAMLKKHGLVFVVEVEEMNDPSWTYPPSRVQVIRPDESQRQAGRTASAVWDAIVHRLGLREGDDDLAPHRTAEQIEDSDQLLGSYVRGDLRTLSVAQINAREKHHARLRGQGEIVAGDFLDDGRFRLSARQDVGVGRFDEWLAWDRIDRRRARVLCLPKSCFDEAPDLARRELDRIRAVTAALYRKHDQKTDLIRPLLWEEGLGWFFVLRGAGRT